MGPSDRSGTSSQVDVEARGDEAADGGRDDVEDAAAHGDAGDASRQPPPDGSGESDDATLESASDPADERSVSDDTVSEGRTATSAFRRRGRRAGAERSRTPTVFDDLADGDDRAAAAGAAARAAAAPIPDIVEAAPDAHGRPEAPTTVRHLGGPPPDAFVPAPPSPDDWADVPDAPLVVNSPQASIGRPADLRPVGRRPRVRKVSRVLRHIDPWSTFKLAAIFSVVLYGVLLTAGVLLWNVALNTGTVDNVERWFTQFGWERFELNGGEIYHNAWILGLFGAIGLTGFAVLSVTLFNLVSDIIGGVRMTVLEEEVVERTVSPARRFVVRRPVGHHQFPVHPEHEDHRTQPDVAGAGVPDPPVESPPHDR